MSDFFWNLENQDMLGDAVSFVSSYYAIMSRASLSRAELVSAYTATSSHFTVEKFLLPILATRWRISNFCRPFGALSDCKNVQMHTVCFIKSQKPLNKATSSKWPANISSSFAVPGAKFPCCEFAAHRAE